MNIWEVLIMFFAFQAGLIGIFFFLKKSDKAQSNQILAFFLFCFGFCIFYNTVFWSGLLRTDSFIHITHLYLLPQALLAPLFYFYIRGVVKRKGINLKKDFWHFIPAIYILIAFFPFFILSSQEKLAIIEQRIPIRDVVNAIPHIGVLLTLLMVVYMAFTYFGMVKFFKNDVDLGIWLKAICLAFLGCVVAYATYYAMSYSRILLIEHDYIITIAMAIFVGLTSYFAFNQPEVFNGKPINRVIPFIKYQKTGLSESLSEALKLKLTSLMENERPYLESNIRLDDIANQLNISRHHASQIINEHFQLNFNDFINRYRIEDAIKILERDSLPYSVKEIVYQVGFNNTVSFYKAFKKHTGITPTDYRKEFMSKQSKRSLSSN